MSIARRFGLLMWLLALAPSIATAAGEAKPVLAGPSSGDAPPATARPPAVLIISAVSHELAADLQKDGFTVNCLGGPGLNGPALTWEQIKKYNVILLTDLGSANADLSLPDKVKANLQLLNRFLNEGGGIFSIPYATLNSAPRNLPQEVFLKSLGLTPLFNEVIFDPETGVKATAWKIDYAHTENIARDSPLTVGVTSLWYPYASPAGGASHSTTFVAGAEWTVAVRGSKTAVARRSMSATAPVGHYASEPPLVAGRVVGKGRIVYLGVEPEYLLAEFGLTTLERIVFDRGLKNVPSHGYLLLRNALRWLAEPSVKEGVLGGAPMDAALLRDPAKVTVFRPPFDWKTGDQQRAAAEQRSQGGQPTSVDWKTGQAPAAFPALAGVIGARSASSSGRGTAEDWVKQAKAQGLAYLVFLEEFARLPKEKFEELKRECARLTTPEFAAIPGFAIDDEIGNHYFYFGPSVAYPGSKSLSKDGTVFVSYAPELDSKNPYLKGQISDTTMHYVVHEGSFTMTAGNFLFSQDAAPFANFFSCWDAAGVITVRDGKVVEDATQDYLSLVDFGQGLLPLAINLIDDPAKLARCRWKTVLRLDPSGASSIGETLEGSNKVAAYWGRWHQYPDNPVRVYISSGPEIVRWAYTGDRDYEFNNQGDFVWENLRWKVHGAVKSAVGLKEVAVYDGPELFRRFSPTGIKEFEFTLDLTHDKQHNLVLIATDVHGDRAISSDQWDRNHRLEEVVVGDRDNQLWGGLSIKQNGDLLSIMEFKVTPDHRADLKRVMPSGVFKYDALLGAPAFDGGTYGEPDVWAPLTLRSKKGEIQSPTVCESFRLFDTGDVNIGEGRSENNFTDNIRVDSVFYTLWKTEPARDFVVTKRNTFFNVDPDSPLAVILWTMKTTLKRDLPNNGLKVGYIDARESRFWALRGSDQSFHAGYWKTDDRSNPRQLRAPFNRAAYAAALDSPLGGAAVFSLTDGMEMTMSLPQNSDHRIEFELPAAQTPQKKDESREVSLLLLGIPRATDFSTEIALPTTEVVERFRHDFGLDGGRTGYALGIKEGTLLGQRYILDVDGRKSQCFSGTLQGDLISSLPIRVAGLQDRWSAFLYDRALRKARPLGIFENKAWASVKLHGRLDLFVGHPILCDQPELFIQVTQSGENAWTVEIHNPTDATIRTTLRKNPAFDPFVSKRIQDAELEIPAGESVLRSL